MFFLHCGFILADNLSVFGTFDFNQNRKSEIFKLNGLLAPLELVELDKEGNHQTLWSYSPQDGSIIVDVKFSDLNQDKIPELIVAHHGADRNDWLSIFEWNGKGFIKNKEKIITSAEGSDKSRPSNLASFTNIFSVSLSTPTRSAAVFSLSLQEGVPVKSDTKRHAEPLISNGYGPVYVGIFTVDGEGYAALLSPEGNILKASVFSLSDMTQTVESDILVLNGARGILGPDIQAFDENNDGQQELLIPFSTGEIYALGFTAGGLTFTESTLSRLGLFGMKPAAGEVEINNSILARVESGLYAPPLGLDQSTFNDSLLMLVSDTLMLGDTLDLFVLPDSSVTFYSFQWESTPPAGMRFNPSAFTIEWVPKRDHIGVVDVSYALNVRLKEELMSGQDRFGDTHHIHPVLQAYDSSMVVLIGDTIKPPEPFVLIPPRFHRISISTKDINEADRFTFDGETPFSTTSINMDGVITVGVAANLSWIKHDKSGAFNFKSSAEKPDSIITLSLIHDLSNNIFYASLSPSADSLAQSFDPGGWDKRLSGFPEYFFEGFPVDMALDSIVGNGVSMLSSQEKMSGSISITSPLYAQNHSMSISYYGGRPHSIRGDISVRENGSHKTLTEIDFESSFLPLSIAAALTSVSRDTLVFHADSIPDTLKAGVSFRSFYAPAKMLEKTMPSDPSTPIAIPDSITFPKPESLPDNKR